MPGTQQNGQNLKKRDFTKERRQRMQHFKKNIRLVRDATTVDSRTARRIELAEKKAKRDAKKLAAKEAKKEGKMVLC